VAIQEFSSGPQNYFEPGYFDGDYTEPNVSRAFLECDIDKIRGGRVVTGEYYLGNYIDGTYYHNNSIKTTVTVTADKIINGNASLQDYFEPGYFVNGYIEPRSAKATVSCQATRTRDATATFASVFQQTAQARLITDINLFAFGDAAIAVEVSRIRGNNIAASSVFSVATDFVVERSADADVDAVFSAIINGLRSRDVNLQTQAAFSFASATGVVKQGSSSVSAQADMSTVAERVRNLESDQITSSSLSVTAIKIKSLQADLAVVCSVSATVRKIRDAHLTGTGVAALSCSASFSGVFSAQMQSTAVITANAGKRISAASSLTAFSMVSISKYAGSGRPRNLVPNNTVQFVAPGKYGSHAFGPVAPTTFVSGQLLLPRPVIPKSNQDWVWEGYYFLPFGALTETNIWTFNVGGGSRFVRLTARDDQRFILSMSKVGINFSASSTESETRGVFHHLAVVYSNGFGALFVNGVRRILLNLSAHTTVDWTGKTVEAQDLTMALTVRGTAALDEVSMHHGSTLGFDPQSLSLTVPTQPRVNNFATTQFLYHFNNNALDDIAVLENAVSNFSAVSQISASLTGPVRVSSALVSTSSLQATISHIEGADLVAFANSTMVVNVDKLRIAAASVTSVSSISTTVVKTASAVSNLAASCELTATANRTRPFTADITALGSQLTAAIRIRGLLVDDLSEFVINASVNKIGSAVSAVSASSSLQATALKIKQLDSALTIQATVSAVGVSAKIVSATISSAFTISTDAKRLRSTVIAVASNTQLIAAGNNLGKIESTLFNTASVTANINKTVSAVASISAVSTVNAVVARTRDTASAVNSSTAITADAQRVTTASAVFATVASQLSVAAEISGLQASLTTAVTLTAVASRIRNVSANITTISQLTGALGKIISLSSALTASSTFTANAGRRVGAAANIASAMQFVVVAREIRLDNIVYVIPGETRVYVIKGETRIHRIREETRYYTI
jgi:hypothetical protein